MDSTCKNCLEISSLLIEKFNSVSYDTWHSVRHKNLIEYAEHNNGVSESGSSYICNECFFLFETYSHIGMDDDEIGLILTTNISENDLLEIAATLVMSDEASLIQKKIVEQGLVQVYLFADLWGQTVYYHGTVNETKLYSLETLHMYGLNHNEYSRYFELYLSLFDLITNAGKNDLYYEKSFIVSFVLRAEDIDIKVSSSSIRMTTQKVISPEKINMYNLETGIWTPLTDVSIKDCFHRNHSKYLKLLRDQQMKNNTQIEVKEMRKSLIQQKVEQIKEFFIRE